MAEIATFATAAFAGLVLYLLGGTVVFSAIFSIFSSWTIALIALVLFTFLYLIRR